MFHLGKQLESVSWRSHVLQNAGVPAWWPTSCPTYDVGPFGRPQSVVPKRRQAEGVSGAVGEIEPTVQRVGVVLGVRQPRQARTDEACELLRIGRFLSEDVPRTRETLKRR
jgi:hypothetical protein